MTVPPEIPAAVVPLSGLAERLRARTGVDPSARELAEALWLAEHVGRPEVRPPEPESADAEEELDESPFLSEPGSTGAPPGEPAARIDLATPAPDPPDRTTPTTRLYADRSRPASHDRAEQGGPEPDFARVRVPVATALPDSLALQRALRPLQRYHPPVRTTAHHLDEQATAERAAETGLFTPVLRPGARREARLRLLMDASTSTSVWDSTLEELRQICAGLGAFREVQAHYVHQGPDGQLAIGTSRDPGRGLRAAEQLRDPTGRQLTLVLSDCAGPLWRSGQMQRLLHHWTQAAPVAVVQPLPQRLWRRTHLPALPGTLRRREGLGARLEFRPTEGDVPSGALPVPVLGPTRAALGTWARLLSGGTGLSLPAAAAWVHANHPAAPPRAERPPADAGRLVTAFRRSASRQAVSLAVSFSAVPLNLPVMQLVQRVMLPRSGPNVLAEVLLGGLMRRGQEDGWYEFVPGVREELLCLLPRGDALLLLKHCGTYVERHFGRRARNFPALALARLTGDAGTVAGTEAVPAAFAKVSDLVVGRYLGRSALESVARRRAFDVVYDVEDQLWGTWLAHVFAACGHEVNLRPWDGEGGMAAVVGRSLQTADEPGRHLVFLLGHREEFYEPWLPQSAARDNRPLTVDVTPYATAAQADESLAGLTEGIARWRLLRRFGIDWSADADHRHVPAYPGAARMVLGEVPQRTPGYVYRRELLEELAARFEPHAPVSCALVGSPAGGKSQAAAEYVHRHADEYDLVWWISDDDREEFAGTARRFGNDLGIPSLTADGVAALLRELGRAGVCWLVVHDGLDDLDSAAEWLYSGGHVLITTRDSAWEEIVPAVRVRTGREAELSGPAADREELVRRALVRLHAEDRTGDTVSGSGFFLAPGWVVTSARLVERWTNRVSVEAVTMDGQSYRVEQVHSVEDLALVRVPGAVDPDCLWLSDVPYVSPGDGVALYSTTGVGTAVYLRSFGTALRIRSIDGRNALWVGDAPLPLDGRGGPVIDSVDGAVVGVLTDPAPDGGGRAVRIGLLRTLCESGRSELWHTVVRAHDRHHAERFRARGPHMTWTGVHEWLVRMSSAVGKIPPVERTELYGLLAELPPPAGPEVVDLLLGERREDRYPPYSWRDGAGLLRRGDSADLTLTYAARVWAELAARGGSASDPGLVKLRTWIKETVRTRDEITRRAVEDVLGSVRGVVPFRDNYLLVDLAPRLPDLNVHPLRITHVRGEERTIVSELDGTTYSDVRDGLVRRVMDALRKSHTAESRPNVMFSLPPELLWAPLWGARTMAELTGPPGGTPRSVVVRAHDRTGRPAEAWRRCWNALSEVVSPRGRRPLFLNSATTRRQLEEAPDSAVPVGCSHQVAALQDAWSFGFPLILWSSAPRHEDCPEVYERAAELLEWAETPGELLSRVARVRILNAGPDPYPDAAWAQHLVIHYDPPDLP
ncbi:SAV_2336 N-terminal domain-related protein [Streptomyces sp. NPDC005538]|uniref:SAV_2336 N-terminal domain-related protein n=1 Tax=unclassified Streptomyces TaxID=2593676 RepID=UPI0033BADBEC